MADHAKNSKDRQRSLAGRIGAFALHARRDVYETTAAGRAAARTALDARLIARFDIDLESVDGPRRLEAARRAHFAALALRSAKARQRRSGAK
ncbi:MAG: hypothetical protein O2894_13615 [Planctomycetota bacterium]|nr:hypothetical protein [Planctomycetota bacterium]